MGFGIGLDRLAWEALGAAPDAYPKGWKRSVLYASASAWDAGLWGLELDWIGSLGEWVLLLPPHAQKARNVVFNRHRRLLGGSWSVGFGIGLDPAVSLEG